MLIQTLMRRCALAAVVVAFLFPSVSIMVAQSRGTDAIREFTFKPKRKTVIQEKTISLPQTNGAWLIEMSRGGGMRPGKQSVSVNSDGEISVVSEHYESGRIVVDCSLKEKLTAEDLRKLKAALRAARISKWREGYDDPKHPICCDQPTTRLTLRRLEIAEGDGGGIGTISQSTSWYPGSSELRPKDLVELAALVQTLWNNAREHCAG